MVEIEKYYWWLEKARLKDRFTDKLLIVAQQQVLRLLKQELTVQKKPQKLFNTHIWLNKMQDQDQTGNSELETENYAV